MRATVNQGRRTFLQAGAAAGGGLAIGFCIPGTARIAEAAGEAKLNAFVTIGTDGKVTVVCGQSEMGQGCHNSLSMLIAEELEVDLKNVHIEQGGIDPAFGNPRYIGFKAVGGFQATGGSSSVRNVGVVARRAGAAARFMLVSAGAEKMQVLRSECVAENGYVIHKPSGRKVSYGSVANDAAKMMAPDEPALKPRSEFKIIGKSTPRHDLPLKVTGKPIYGMDVRRPGLLTAVIAKCPVFGGKVKSFDATQALKVPGVKKVVQVSSGVAVVADGFWAAKKGRDALAIAWDEGSMAKVSSPDLYRSWAELAKGPTAAERLKTGDVGAALEDRDLRGLGEPPGARSRARTAGNAADDDDADQRPEEERGEDPAVELHPAELAGDDRHDRRDRQCLESDQRDGQDEPDGQRASLGRPETVVVGDGLGHGRHVPSRMPPEPNRCHGGPS